jgi:hypothetical protein
MQLIRITKENLSKELFEDVVFLKYAEPGAMPKVGVIYFITRDCKLYGFSYLRGDVQLSDVLPLFPALSQCRFNLFGRDSKVPEGWHYMYVGVGNHLMIHGSVYPAFQEQIKDYRLVNEVSRDWRILAQRSLLGE